MKKVVLSLLIAYLLGSINPAAIVAKFKKKNLREEGTKNLGATNTMMVMGKKWGALVMAFDIAKAYLAVKIAELLVPATAAVAMASGFFAIVGHCFPFHMKFKGGKGLAAFGGVVLAYSPGLFLFLLSTAVILILIVNYSFIMPFYASVAFPLHVALHTDSVVAVLFAFAASLLIFVKHFGNFKKACRGEDVKVREYIRTKLFH
ncbi:MAG: glycerol-3-phosphate acyltransferase [Clostridia bacterium]|nr:glycerol-3-phosphate acyltransferase [Clostridia bacterium]